jgi:hypothetical protein
MAALWGEQVGRFERAAPGFQGGVLLREGCACSPSPAGTCRPSAEAALEPLLDRMASSALTDLLAEPPSCRLRPL